MKSVYLVWLFIVISSTALGHPSSEMTDIPDGFLTASQLCLALVDLSPKKVSECLARARRKYLMPGGLGKIEDFEKALARLGSKAKNESKRQAILHIIERLQSLEKPVQTVSGETPTTS